MGGPPVDDSYGSLPYLTIDLLGNLPYIYVEACTARFPMSPTMRAPVRSKRLEIRTTPEQKRLFERAATIRGTSVTDFVVNRLLEAAREIIQESESMRLRDEDRKVFFNALLKPPAPNAYAKAAVARYKKRVRG